MSKFIEKLMYYRLYMVCGLSSFIFGLLDLFVYKDSNMFIFEMAIGLVFMLFYTTNSKSYHTMKDLRLIEGLVYDLRTDIEDIYKLVETSRNTNENTMKALYSMRDELDEVKSDELDRMNKETTKPIKKTAVKRVTTTKKVAILKNK